MSKEFWGGFWSVFRHPVTIYAFGFAGGFATHGILVALLLRGVL